MSSEALLRIEKAQRTRATSLSLSGLELREIPAELAAVTTLTRLNLRNNRLSVLPDWLGNLTSLTTLELGGNQLTALPDWMGNLTNLTTLELGSNQLTAVPETLGNLTNLTTLGLDANQLTALPETLGNLTNLTILELGNNQLSAIPDWLGNLTNLATLGLSDNQLTALPDTLRNLTNLTILELSHNQLTALPDAVCNLVGLGFLNAGNNRLTVLPDEIGALTELAFLYLTGNQLTALPDQLGTLTRLNVLYLNDNHLTVLPDWIGDLPHLDRLAISGNDDLVSPPPSVLAQGTKAVLAFLGARRQRAERQWRSKVLVVGQGRAGKTSLVKALSGKPHDAQEPTTHGLNVSQLELAHPLPDVVGEEVRMRLAVWDFGGQEIYYATHQFFLTGQSLFVLVWSSGAGYEYSRLRYWLDLISAREPGAPIIVVATQTAERAPDLPQAELAAAYPAVRAWVSVDNETRAGIDELRDLIGEYAAGLPLMGAPWPAAWLAALQACRDLPGTHISLAEFQKVLGEAGMTAESDQLVFTGVLHQLGEILHYTHDRELSELVILKPQWLGVRMSEILDSKPVEERSGLLHHEDVTAHWRDLGLDLRRHLLSMMDTFDVSYRVDDAEIAAIVVERLPWDPPAYHEAWARLAPPNSRQIRLRYTIDGAIPPGIPTWFIARSHRFSTEHFRPWRTGALRQHHDGKHLGLISVDTARNTIDLTVRGPLPAAFFSILDDGLKVTFSRYPGLRLTAAVPCHCAEDCTTQYAYDKLLLRAERGILNVECDSSLEQVSIAALLYGFTPASTDDPAQMQARFDQLAHQMQGQTELLQREFIKMVNAEHARCPCVFTLTLVKDTVAGLAKPGQTTYQLQLYCEEPGAWHPLPEGAGSYRIADLSKWRHALNRNYNRAAKTLSLPTLIAGAATGIPAPALPLVETNRPALQDLGDLLEDSWSTPSARAETDAQYRVLEQLLAALDPKRQWGGLSKITTPEDLTLYVCPEHVARYLTPQKPHQSKSKMELRS
ncbi:hypothetical protein Rhe02_22840 [Rhizocola hellebori]|uniref:non-specific serine/threonine protein kinase n=1 Tax=Rhizocola hellebori TaxID=1392758 RepID=A0A8J3Q6C0_9ACTN|nr:COR domain-containing protein [Rhizocola hellebori]GIH04217.1 hypothetical protein Rhe02_22840 [Rhizocola hellebori]